MRPVLAGDVFALAQLLRTKRVSNRSGFCRQILSEADHADKYRKRLGRLHGDWGNGSLMGRALTEKKVDRRCCADFQSEEFCANLSIVLEELAAFREYKRSKSGR